MREEEIVKKIVSEVLLRIEQGDSSSFGEPKAPQVKVGADSPSGSAPVIYCNYSNRHCHLSREAVDALFGAGYDLQVMKNLIQPGEFAGREVLTLVGPKGTTLPIRVLGPIRAKTQVEISRNDSFVLDIKDVPIRESGDTEGSPGVVLVGPKGAYNLKSGVIIAWRHIHFTPEDAKYFGVKDKDMLRVKIESPQRSLVFHKVLARVKEGYALEMHIDADEANAAGVGQMTPVTIIKE